jgi:hypothetical protein
MAKPAYAHPSGHDLCIAPRSTNERVGLDRAFASRDDRIAVEAAVILNAELDGVQATARDVSPSGLRISIDPPPATGPITVKLVGLPIFSGQVCWSMDRQIGVKLEQPLSPECLSTWISIHGQLASSRIDEPEARPARTSDIRPLSHASARRQ